MADNVLLTPVLAQAQKPEPEKNPHAQAMGHLRSAKLPPERRKAIASEGGQARAKKLKAAHKANEKDESPKEPAQKKRKKKH